jgi:histidyl-tRNA synthetase
MEFEILKGTKDWPPKEAIKINKILNVIKNNFEKFGFRPFETPNIEFLETLTYKYDEDAEIVNEIFKVKDRGNRKLGLRYDLTTPLCRFIAQNRTIKLPFKRYHIGKVFRDGPIKKGRLREFIQCDGDVIGIEGREIEAELLTLFYNTYKELKIDAVIELNNNKILQGAFLQIGFNKNELSSLILSVDKLKKIGLNGVLKEIKEKNLDENKAKLAIEILNSKDFEEIKKKANNKTLLEGIKELEELTNLLKLNNIEFRINFSMARGLDIYTSNIWEAYDKNETISSSIGSGGRYDNIINEFIGNKTNKKFPAVGISFGLIPIIEVLESNKKITEKEGLTNLLIVPLKKEFVPICFKLADKYRNENLNVEIFYGYKLNKAFEYCDHLEIDKIIVIGEKDISNKKYLIKDLKTKKTEEINLEY